MVKLYGISTTRGVTMIKLLKKILFGETTYEYLIEGVYAHQYPEAEAELRDQIIKSYNKKYKPKPTPLSHPERFDPLNPPSGWAYDPYYEMWIEY